MVHSTPRVSLVSVLPALRLSRRAVGACWGPQQGHLYGGHPTGARVDPAFGTYSHPTLFADTQFQFTCSESLPTRSSLSPTHINGNDLSLFTAVMFIRAYAFSGRRRTALAVLSLCFGAIFSVAVWVFCTHTPIPSPELFGMFGGMGCFPDYRKEIMGLRLGVSLDRFANVGVAI